jgi:hypothetical protein
MPISGRRSAFTAMTDVGNRVIVAQNREEQIGKRYAKHRTSELLSEWKAARREVEMLAREYVEAIRTWRESIENEISSSQHPPRINP